MAYWIKPALLFLLLSMSFLATQSHAPSVAVISQKDIAHFCVVDEHIIHIMTIREYVLGLCRLKVSFFQLYFV